jgi:hypothetical protein
VSTVTGPGGEPASVSVDQEDSAAVPADQAGPAEPDPGDPGQAAGDPGPAVGGSGPGAADPGLAAERDRLARALRETRLQLAMTQARLGALEQSATMELGRTLVRAARRPWPRGVQLPLDLVRLWRERGSPTGPGASTLALASAQLGDLAGGGERFLSALTAPGLGAPGATSASWNPPGLVVTGVLSARACATLGPDAAVHPLLPHDADVMLESTGADVVLIEAAAMLGSSAWAYAGDPAAVDRGRRLGRLIAAARALGKPVIFVRNVPAYLEPGLTWVAASCDAVLDGGFGVQLARFNPIGVTRSRPRDPVYAGSRDPREPPGVRARLDAVAGSVEFTGELPWRRLPALYRDRALFVTACADQALEQAASGARVITLDDRQAADELAERIAAARAEEPLGEAEVVPVLREIFARHATPVMLARLARLAGLTDRVIAGRQVAVLARVQDAAEASALSARLRGQRMAPAEVVLVVDGTGRAGSAELNCRAAAAALSDLGDAATTVRVIPGAQEAQDPAGWVAQAARAACAPWAAPWQPGGEYGETYLLDLACARECSQADAVGYGGTCYAFTASLTPALARRQFFGPGELSHGLRFFSVS